ncbi:MAG: TonB-dependent receptor [Candidatus Symbiothrix sp.]|jgi:iron complex outermembrane receptor protein|nr:TonB-dependent receptor [Candidatus Symbiothrix sp.]
MKQTVFHSKRAHRFKRFARKSYAAFNSMHKVVNIGVVAGFVLTFAHATQSSAQAQTAAARDTIAEQERELDELLVTSSKAELTLNQTAKLVTVITREEIERQPAGSIPDLLKNRVGVDVRQRGGNGVQTDISLRGGTFDQIAILLNGANLTNPHTGHYSFDLPVNLSDIDHIEIIQGPTSLLYGAGAFSGGINIVTKKNSETGAYLKAEGGMHELWGVEGRAVARNASTTQHHSLSAGYHSSGGYIADSDYKILNALWQSNFRVDNSKLDIQLGLNNKAYGANTFYSAAYPDQFDETQSIFAAIRGESGTKLKFIPQIYWNRHYDTFQLIRGDETKVPYNHHQSDVLGINLNTQYKWIGGITNFGGELRNEGIFSSNLGVPMKKPVGKYKKSDNRTNISYFLEHNYLYQGFTLGLGVLANYNTAYANDMDFYPNIHAAWRISTDWKIFASWNNATRLPTFTDLYYVAPEQQGQPDLQPEKSESVELGLKYDNRFLSISFTGFDEQGKNLIDWIKETPNDAQWKATNLTSVDKTGFEINAAISFQEILPQLSTTRLNLGYMFLHQTRDANNLISNYVLDYLRHKFTAGIYQPIYKGLTADWQFRWQQRDGGYNKFIGRDEKNTPIYQEEAYPAFALLDLKLNWKLNDFTVYLTANNLFNVSYYDRGNIPQPGFWLLGGISYTSSFFIK